MFVFIQNVSSDSTDRFLTLFFFSMFFSIRIRKKTVLKSRSDDILNVTYILVAIISRCTWGNNMDKTLCSLSPSVQLALFCSPILLLRRQCENRSITFSGLIFQSLVTETGGQAHRQFVSEQQVLILYYFWNKVRRQHECRYLQSWTSYFLFSSPNVCVYFT